MEQQKQTCSTLSVIFGAIAFLLFPPLFGIAGLVLGIIGAVVEEDKGRPTLGIVLSVVGGIGGMILGAWVVNQLG